MDVTEGALASLAALVKSTAVFSVSTVSDLGGDLSGICVSTTVDIRGDKG